MVSLTRRFWLLSHEGYKSKGVMESFIIKESLSRLGMWLWSLCMEAGTGHCVKQ